jgi:hypothetical protein
MAYRFKEGKDEFVELDAKNINLAMCIFAPINHHSEIFLSFATAS